MEVNRQFFFFFFFSNIFTICTSVVRPSPMEMANGGSGLCVHGVRENQLNHKGGTDSIISLTLYDPDGYGLRINDLESWANLMGPDHNYFERGNLDIFSGRGPCLPGPVCKMNLTSDGSGSGHGWYCNYVELTATGVHKECTQEKFTVEQWLAMDAPPYELTAVRDYCSSDEGEGEGSINGLDSSIVAVV